MTNPTEAAKQRACDDANKAPGRPAYYIISDVQPGSLLWTLACSYQAVSDAVKGYAAINGYVHQSELSRFILPDPEPDPQGSWVPELRRLFEEGQAKALAAFDEHVRQLEARSTITRTEER